MRFLTSFVLILGLGTSIAFADVFESVHKCDEHAAHPSDPNRWAAGVDDIAIIPGPAVKFCQEAVAEHELTPRFLFQLGRSLWAAARDEEGLQTFLDLEEAFDYPPVYAYLGDAYMHGIGGAEIDEELAVTLYQIAGESGFAPALQVLSEISGLAPENLGVASVDGPNLGSESVDTTATSPLQNIQATRETVEQERISSGEVTEATDASFRFDGFNQPALLQRLYNGDFEDLQSQGRLLTSYLTSFNGFFGQTVNFIDQSCVLLYEPRIEKALMQRLYGNVVGGGTVMEQGANASREIGQIMIDMQQGGPAVLIDRVGEITVAEQEGEKDAARLAQTVGCEHPVSKRLYTNISAFVFNRDPIMSSNVAERKINERFEDEAGKSCIASFDQPAFCQCMIATIIEMDISDQDKNAIGQNFRTVASLGSSYPDLRDAFRTCRSDG